MSVFRRLFPVSVLGLVAAVGLLGACTDETIVFRDREPFNPPPDAASGFLGYYTAAEQQTTCGNCHVGTHKQWRDASAHSGAWAGLVAIGQDDNPACYSCHAVTEFGNPATAASGMNVVADEAYHDVQCESCHGPGFDHVQEPDNPANWPLARADITNGADPARTLDTDASCASCHGSEHGARSLAGDWLISGHAAENEHAQENPSCAGCHEGKTIMERFSGQASNYVERDVAAGEHHFLEINCTACHDPHGSPNTAMLRAPIDVPDLQANLCMACHNRGTAPSASFSNSSRGPHAAQGPILIGLGAGYSPAGFAFDTVQAYGTHASGANPRLCAGCHVNSFSASSGGVDVEYSGHEFLAIPCVDANGAITDDQSCGFGATERSWASCTAAGCHGDATVASTALVNQMGTIQDLIDIIWINNDGNDPFDANADWPKVSAGDGGYLGEIFAADPTQFTAGAPLTAAEGAKFNAMMLAEDLYDHNDGSHGVHNPFYYEALLAATINELEDVYGGILSIRTEPALRAMIDKALSRPGVTYTRRSNRVASR